MGAGLGTVTPLSPGATRPPPVKEAATLPPWPVNKTPPPQRPLAAPAPAKARKPRPPGTTLDAGWDRRLARGSVEPDATVDLHGHTLSSAYGLLDRALDRSRARGDRIVLLVTGKPPRPGSERPHARGAIRAVVGDWLQASRHAESIAAVRGANPRHGGAGALYIVLRRPRTAPKS